MIKLFNNLKKISTLKNHSWVYQVWSWAGQKSQIYLNKYATLENDKLHNMATTWTVCSTTMSANLVFPRNIYTFTNNTSLRYSKWCETKLHFVVVSFPFSSSKGVSSSSYFSPFSRRHRHWQLLLPPPPKSSASFSQAVVVMCASEAAVWFLHPRSSRNTHSTRCNHNHCNNNNKIIIILLIKRRISGN